MSSYRALMRRKLLADIYDRMSDEEKRTFVQLSLQDRDHTEIMQALQGVSRQVDEGRHSFSTDLLANVSGNALWDGLLWVSSRLLKRL